MSKSVIIDNLVNDQLYGFRIFPRNLKGQYQTETDGATAIATPKAIPPIFGEATWEQINLASTTNTIPSTWHVGDIKDITLTTGETITMQIYGFNHDDLADGSGKKAGITLGMKNLMNDVRKVNSNANINTFGNSDLNYWVQNDLYNIFPVDLQPFIKLINKKNNIVKGEYTISQTKIFLFSVSEILGGNYVNTYKDGSMYDCFNDVSRRIKKLSNGNGEFSYWWTRTLGYSSSSNANVGLGIDGYGNLFSGPMYSFQSGICFGFCI